MLEVVTVWAPRPDHEKWQDEYRLLLDVLGQSVRRVGHRHVVVTDGTAAGDDVLKAKLPRPLMLAILAGQIAYLEQWSGDHHVVLVDADCLVSRRLDEVFSGEWDIGLTSREGAVPIQNGAIYLARGSKAAALALFRHALAFCRDHWGGDQEALAQAVAPVPKEHCVQERFGVRVAFLSTDPFNFTPGNALKPRHDRFILHFKGTRKDYALDYAKLHLKIRPAKR